MAHYKFYIVLYT